MDNVNIAEICWIVDQRNKWARRRGIARSKMNYARDSSKPKNKIKRLVLSFAKINAEKEKLRKYTLRLRRLLKKENCFLRSDSSAGYDAIVIRNSSSQIGLIERTQISVIAADFEVNLQIQKMLIGKSVKS